MRSSILSRTSYQPNTVLNSTVFRKVMNLNIPNVDTLRLGGSLPIPGKLTKIIEVERNSDSIVINGFVAIEKEVFHVMHKVLMGNNTYVYTDVNGVSSLIKYLTDESVSSLRGFVSDLIVAKTDDTSMFEESSRLRECCTDLISNLDNEGSSIYETIDGFKEQYLVDAVLDGFEDDYTMYSCLDFFDAGEAKSAYCRDIVKSMSQDDIFTSGVVTTYDILSLDGTGARFDVIRQLSKPFMNDNYTLNRASEIYLSNPVCNKDEFLRYLCNDRRYINGQMAQLEPVSVFSQELMNWLTTMHSCIFEGQFTYILPEGSIKNARAGLGCNNYLKNYKFIQCMKDFTSAFSELIDFSSAREIEISITQTEDMYVRFRDKDRVRTLYFDLLLTCCLSYGLIRNVNT